MLSLAPLFKCKLKEENISGYAVATLDVISLNMINLNVLHFSVCISFNINYIMQLVNKYM